MSCWRRVLREYRTGRRRRRRRRTRRRIKGEKEKKEEKDEPLEDRRRKDLAAECKALGLSDCGVNSVLIDKIKKARAAADQENNDE